MKLRKVDKKKPSTRSRILNAAGEVFAESGFEGARVDEIARRADLNKATLYYHIGDKKALYAEVLHDLFSTAMTEGLAGIDCIEDPGKKLSAYIQGIARSMEQSPNLAPIMTREIASGARYLPEVVAHDLSQLIKILTGIMEAGAEEGVFIKTIPFIIHMMVAGAFLLYKNSFPVRTSHDAFPESLKSLDRDISGNIVAEIEKLILRAVTK